MASIADKLGKQVLGDGTKIPFPVNLVDQTVLCSEMTDGGATGYIDLDKQIPAGSLVLAFFVRTLVKMDEDTSAAVTVGIAGATDSLSGVTDPDCAAVGNFGGSPINPNDININGTPLLTAATTVRVTITGAGTFSLIAAGDGQWQIQVLYVRFPFAAD